MSWFEFVVVTGLWYGGGDTASDVLWYERKKRERSDKIKRTELDGNNLNDSPCNDDMILLLMYL